MAKKLSSLIGSLALSASIASSALAASPVELTDQQMDKVAAGLSQAQLRALSTGNFGGNINKLFPVRYTQPSPGFAGGGWWNAYYAIWHAVR
jgi:hypothetical protein